MLEWIKANSQMLNAWLNLGMLIVWIAYLQIFILNYRRQRRANILINVGGGTGWDTKCLVSNMSSEAIYVQGILVEAEGRHGRSACFVTELDDVEAWERPTDLNLWTRQGPLGSGEVRDMGAVRLLLEHVLQRGQLGDGAPRRLEDIAEMTVTVCAVYTSEDLLVGARRRFQLDGGGGDAKLRPATIGTRQIHSRRQRRRLEILPESG